MSSNRTIIVSTRLNDDTLHTTYLNELDGDPFIGGTTVMLKGKPFKPVGLKEDEIPEVGETNIIVRG